MVDNNDGVRPKGAAAARVGGDGSPRYTTEEANHHYVCCHDFDWIVISTVVMTEEGVGKNVYSSCTL